MIDLEALRTLFQDRRTYLSLGIIEKIELVPDKSNIRCQVKSFPENNSVIANVGWSGSGPGAGMFMAPEVNDLVLMAYASEDMIYIISRLSSKEDFVPEGVLDGHTVIKHKEGKKILMGRAGDVEPDEPVVCGNIALEYLTALHSRINAILDILIAGQHVLSSTPGNPTAPNPTVVADLTELKVAHEAEQTEFLDTAATNILAANIFVEKGV